MAQVLALVVLALSLAFAVLRPRGATEALVAVPGAALLVALGVVPLHSALATLRGVGPTVGFLAAILLFGHLLADGGVFDYLGAVATRIAHGESRRLLGTVVILAAGVTATLTLDATVVLMTPVVLAAVARLGVSARPFAYACLRLANSGSLLLPVSNLTNLLAFTATGLSFGRFAALMTLPWLVVCCAEWGALRTYFRADLPRSTSRPGPADRTEPGPPAPRYALVVLAGTVAAIAVTSAVDIAPWWAAAGGCVALLIRRRGDAPGPLPLLRAAAPGFCAFVLALAVIVDGVVRHGLGSGLAGLVPSGTTFLALLGAAVIAAVLANVVNNLPATLALVPVVAGRPALALAVLIGVNVGPNASYPGSLATLLWRRMLPARDKPRAGQFHLFGLLTVPPLIVAATAALWLGVRVVGV